MKRLSRTSIAVASLVIVGLVVAAGRIYRAVDSGMQAAIGHKSAKTTTATVVSVARSVPNTAMGSSSPQGASTICFTLDGLDQVEPDMRSGYEAAEQHRQEAFGARCKATGIAVASSLRTGDKLQVVYLLANDYQIEIVAIRASGVDLGGEGVKCSGSRGNGTVLL